MFQRLLRSSLRSYNEVHIGEVIEHLTGTHEDELFYNCTIGNLSGATLKDCVLTGSKVQTKGVKNALGLTVTLDCNTFGDVELSEDLFDMLLLLLCKSKGNTEKRARLIQIIGKERAFELLKQMEHLEKPHK